MRNVLMMTYYFPPYGIVGGYRPFRFAKFLPEYGWRPIVLTTHGDDPLKRHLDDRLLQQLPPEVIVQRTASWRMALPWRRMFAPLRDRNNSSAAPAIGRPTIKPRPMA